MPIKRGTRIRELGLQDWWEAKQRRNPHMFNSYSYLQLVQMFKSDRQTDTSIAELIGKTRQQVGLYREVWEEEA